MKTTKSSILLGRMVSTHLPPGKDRALANALLRMSERTSIQENNKADDVIYCGETEPFYGWTNTVPNPRYSEKTRPKPVLAKKKKLSKKMKSDVEKYDASSDALLSLYGLPSNVDSYATLRDMYDSYKKSMERRSASKSNKITDPVTFQYVPWHDRHHDPSSDGDISLPSLKMVQATQPSKLMEVLEKYMTRHKGLFNRNNDDSDDSSISAADVFDYYKRYKWNFRKEKSKQSGFRHGSIIKRKEEQIYLPSLTSKRHGNHGIEPNIKEKLARYVNGAILSKTKNRSIYEHNRNAFYIKVREGPIEAPNMVKLERKRKVNSRTGEPSDHWVARVIIKQTDDSSSDRSKHYNDTDSSSSVIIVPDTRWRRNYGVVAEERERIQKEMDKARFHQEQQDLKLSQLRKQLLRNSYEIIERPSHRLKRKEPLPRLVPSNLSEMETAKVSVKYNVETARKKGVVREVSEEETYDQHLKRLGIPQKRNLEKKLAQPNLNRNLTIGSEHVTKILPSGENKTTNVAKQQKQTKTRRLLNRGIGQKTDKVKKVSNENIKLPILPKQVKIEKTIVVKPKNIISESENDEIDKKSSDESLNNSVTGNDVAFSLPFVHGASATFHTALNQETGGSSSRSQSPSLPDSHSELMKQTQTESMYYPTKTLNKNAEFHRYKVIPHPGSKSVTGSSEVRPIHPPHHKNRGQEKIQDLIDQEKDVVNSMIRHLQAELGKNHQHLVANNTLEQPDNFKVALSSAIAKARLIEENKHNQIPPNLTDKNRFGSVVMKRRVVPPTLPAPSNTTKQFRNQQVDIPVVATALRSNGEDTSSHEEISAPNQKEQKQTKRPRRTKLKKIQNRSNRKKENQLEDKNFDNIVLSGDVIVKERPTPKLLEHSFAASISSIRPSRRIVNVVPTEVAQKG